VAARVARLSATFRRSLDRLGIVTGSPAFRAVFATIGGLSRDDVLPGPGDAETSFAPGRAYVRRVAGQNVWLLYRFDADHVAVLTARNQPPVPVEP